MQCNDFDCETIQSAIYKIHISSLNWTKLRFGLQIRFGCTGRQSPSLLGQSGQEWSIADSITILGRTKQSFLMLSSYLSQVSRVQVRAGGAPQANCWGRSVLYTLSSTLPGQISRCHTSVITLGMTRDTSVSVLVLLHHNQTHQQGVIVINVSMYQITANDSFNEHLLTQNTPLWQL